jgi:hypothetical protein
MNTQAQKKNANNHAHRNAGISPSKVAVKGVRNNGELPWLVIFP